MKIFFSLIIASVFVFSIFGQNIDGERPWKKAGLTPKERAVALLQQMNTQEKLTMLHGEYNSPYVGYVPANERLGIPALTLNDGPQGFRDENRPGTSTCWPSTLTMGATWDTHLLYQWGINLGLEFFNKGANVLLGPGLNLARVPNNGRNFEYLSGGDPYLGYSLVQPLIRGIQSLPVIANAKHWIHNNQEIDRDTVSANIDERTRHELYYQPFYGAIKAGVGSFMCSYNKINSAWSCENDQTLRIDLKEHLKFNGWVMSDWGATHSVSIEQGLDQEMPGGDYFGDKLSDLVSSGEIPLTAVDDSVLRILTPMFQVGLFDIDNPNSITNNVTSNEANHFARVYSSASQILLKNTNHLLPLNKHTKQKIAIIGKSALDPIVNGEGSGRVVAPYKISPYQGIALALGISYNSSNVMNCNWLCNDESVCIAYHDGVDIAAASSLASEADVTIVAISQDSSEGIDRDNLSFNNPQFDQVPRNQDDLVNALGDVETPLIVSAVAPGAVLFSWKEKVEAILFALMPGQEYGNALADLLFGEVNPSAKLPMTIPNIENEVGFTKNQYPGVQKQADYSEEMLIDYRWYIANNIKPAFAFGYGLSYTTFSYSGLSIMNPATFQSQGYLKVKATITNTGSHLGSEVAQLYVQFPTAANTPPLQLKGFAKTSLLTPGASQMVLFTLTSHDLSVWSVEKHDWEVIPGEYIVKLGAASDDLKLITSFNL